MGGHHQTRIQGLLGSDDTSLGKGFQKFQWNAVPSFSTAKKSSKTVNVTGTVVAFSGWLRR